jgi:thioredoxin-dependent peroxiredoxin
MAPIDVRYFLFGLSLATLALTACSGGHDTFMYKNYPIADGSAVAGDGHNVLFKGSPLSLSGNGIKVGDQLRSVKLAQPDNTLINLTETGGKGKVRLISVVPSLDTKVCEQQTHYLSEKNKGLDKMVELITVSIDTPFAQKRFAAEANINNVTFLSDFRNADFGKTYGLLLKDPHVLARAVMVVDAQSIIRYVQITPELGQMPDMDEAFQVARRLITSSGETVSKN